MARQRRPRRSFWEDVRGISRAAQVVADVAGLPEAQAVADVAAAALPPEGPDPLAPVSLREKYPNAIDVSCVSLGFYPCH